MRIRKPASVMRPRMCSKWTVVIALRVPDIDTESLMTFEAPGPAQTDVLTQDCVSEDPDTYKHAAVQASSRALSQQAKLQGAT